MKFLIACFVCFVCQSASAEIIHGNEGAHGGDEVGIEFKVLVKSALNEIQNSHPDLKALFSMPLAQSALEQATILNVSQNLQLEIGGQVQNVVAINYPQNKLILVNADRWQRIANFKARQALALHEILSLIGVETTGHYPVSAKFFGELPDSVFISHCTFLDLQDGAKGSLGKDFDIQSKVSTNEVQITLNATSSKALNLVQKFASDLDVRDFKSVTGLIYTQVVKTPQECAISMDNIRCIDLRSGGSLAFVTPVRVIPAKPLFKSLSLTTNTSHDNGNLLEIQAWFPTDIDSGSLEELHLRYNFTSLSCQ